MLRLDKPEDVFSLQPTPAALLVDLDGTLTGFSPSPDEVEKAVTRFDELAVRHNLNLDLLHYVSNANWGCPRDLPAALSGRIHQRARKPFFRPCPEVLSHAQSGIVVGDQYLTDGLEAWRFGLSFALVSPTRSRPTFPVLQRLVGRPLAPLFFRREDRPR